MKYESDILKRLINTYGVVGNPRYISEIIKEFIVRGKESFPNLFTYQADWLAHIDEFGLTPEYTVSYTGQQIYAPRTKEKPVKRAILTGSTKYRDIDTGEILESFEEGRKLELVSVKMPVLTTTGKNVFDMAHSGLREESAYDKSMNGYGFWSFGVKLQPNKEVTISRKNNDGYNLGLNLKIHNENTYNGGNWLIANHAQSGNKSSATLTTNYDGYIWFIFSNNFDRINQILDICEYIQIEYGTQATSYEPYKTNILSVNEDVTLRSNGNICDELNLLTGQLTQRIDEDGEVLSQEVVKTVDLTILDQNGQIVEQLMSFNGGTHFNTGSLEGSPLPSVSVSVVTDLEEILMVCSSEGNTM